MHRLSQVLIEEGAALEALNLGDMTALHIAAYLGHPDVCSALLKVKANVHAYDQQHATPLHHAVTMQQGRVVQIFIQAGASLSARDQVHGAKAKTT